MTNLALYVLDGCGYCGNVLRTIRELGIDVELRNLRDDPEHGRALVEARGRRTVPVLRIGQDVWLGESRDIIAYLRDRFDGREEEPPV